MTPQQYCLRWKYHHSNLQTMFSQLLDRGCFCDVTIACEGQTLRAHRVVLCACSTYFDAILSSGNVESNSKDPIILMRDCRFEDVKCLIEFMYKGEINVEHNNLASLLKTATDLCIKGLAEVTWRDEMMTGGMMAGGSHSGLSATTRKPGHPNAHNTRQSATIHQQHQRTTTGIASVSNIQHQAEIIHHPSAGTRQSKLQPVDNGSSLLTPMHSVPMSVSTGISRNASGRTSVGGDAAVNSNSSNPAAFNASAAAFAAANNSSISNSSHFNQQPHRLELRQQHQLYATSPLSSPVAPPPIKRKRGRPPLDADFDSYSAPRITHVECAAAPPEAFAEMNNLDTPQPSTSTGISHNAPHILNHQQSGSGGGNCSNDKNARLAPISRVDVSLHDDSSATSADDRLAPMAAEADVKTEDEEEEVVEQEEVDVLANLEPSTELPPDRDDAGSMHDDHSSGDNNDQTHHNRPSHASEPDDGSQQQQQKQRQSDADTKVVRSLAWDDFSMQIECEEDTLAGRLVPKLERPETPTEPNAMLEVQVMEDNYDDVDDDDDDDDDDDVDDDGDTKGELVRRRERLRVQLRLRQQQHQQQQQQPQQQFESHFQSYQQRKQLEQQRQSLAKIALDDLERKSRSCIQPAGGSSGDLNTSAQDLLTPQEMHDWRDVVKLNDYLRNGRRPHFWEESFTLRVMEAIKNKSLEMKKAAFLLGVSYGTLYGRYRETYGCLKHSFRSFWTRREANESLHPAIVNGKFATASDEFPEPFGNHSSPPPRPQQRTIVSRPIGSDDQTTSTTTTSSTTVGANGNFAVSHLIGQQQPIYHAPPPPMFPSHPSAMPASNVAYPPPPALYVSDPGAFSFTALSPFMPYGSGASGGALPVHQHQHYQQHHHQQQQQQLYRQLVGTGSQLLSLPSPTSSTFADFQVDGSHARRLSPLAVAPSSTTVVDEPPVMLTPIRSPPSPDDMCIKY